MESSYRRFDLDILLTSYNVQSLIKNTPLLPNDSDMEQVIEYIEQHVKNKKHFDHMVIGAQRGRNVERANGVHWFQRELIPEHYDIYQWKELEE